MKKRRELAKERFRRLVVKIFNDIYGEEEGTKKINELYERGIMVDDYVKVAMEVFDEYEDVKIKPEPIQEVYYMQYRCSQCHLIFSVELNLVYVHGDLPKCPECGSLKTERVYSQKTVENRKNKRDKI